jgi:hypothetical protein
MKYIMIPALCLLSGVAVAMAENTACKNAETSAKENILRSTVPEILKKNAEQNCNITVGEKPKEFEPPKPLAVPTLPVQIAPLINQNGSTQQNSEGFLCC